MSCSLEVIGNSQHAEQVVVVRIDLRPLMDVNDVFQRERMDLEHLGDRPQLLFAAQADDVDPHHGPVAEELLELVRIVDLLLDDAVLVVGHHADGRRRGVGRDGERARLGAGRRLPTNPRLEPATIAAVIGHGRDCSGTKLFPPTLART